MDKKEHIRNIAAGVFFILGILLIIFFIFAIGKDKGLGQTKFQVAVLFRNIGGLTEGAPIRLSGVNIGTVGSIDFLEEEIEGRQVRVTLNIFKKYRNQLEKSTRVVIKTEGILGGKIVEIYVEPHRPALDLKQAILGGDPLDVQDLAEVFVRAAESFTQTSEDLNKIDIQGLTEALTGTSESVLVTSEEINVLIKDLKLISVKSKRLLDRIEQHVIDGTLFKVF